MTDSLDSVEIRQEGVTVEPYTEGLPVIYSEEVRDIEDLDPVFRQVAYQLGNWLTEQRSKPGPLDRPHFEDAKDRYSEMKLSRQIAEEDDIVGNYLEITEGLALQGLKWEHTDPIITDVFNQMAAKQNLDAFIRSMWRLMETENQGVVAFWWETEEFKIRGKAESGNARRATRTVHYPKRLSVLDNTRVLPVEMTSFGGERLVWKMSPAEYQIWKNIQSGQGADEGMERFYEREYKIPAWDAETLRTYVGIDDHLVMLNEEVVKRYTGTRASYQRWAPVRLKSIFRFMDMKLQLMAADRVALVGAANYILLVKKGDKESPAKTEEIRNLKEGFRTLARVPVIFSDHRLEIEIITPKTDFVLEPKKYETLNSQIVQRLINGLPFYSAQGAYRVELGKTTQLALQSRRHMLKRFIEAQLARAVMNHPSNAGVFETTQAPSLAFVPAQIQVGDVTALAQQIISLRTMNEISRDSTLEWFGFDQEAEAMRRKLEELLYDETFQTVIPFSAAGGQGANPAQGTPPAAQGRNGSQGGRPTGGGSPTANPTKPAAKTASGTTSSGTRKKTKT